MPLGGIPMRIIEINENQYTNYQINHPSRNYKQSIEYANTKPKYKKLILGLTDDNNSSTILGAVLILEKKLGNYKIGQVPCGFIIDYNDETLLTNFIKLLKKYLKEKKYIYITIDLITPYKILDKKNNLLYFNTNIIKLLHKLSFIKTNNEKSTNVILKTKLTPNEI